MEQFLISLAVGYMAGDGVVSSIMNSAALSNAFSSTGLKPHEVSLIAGGVIYAANPLPQGINSMAAGFLIGAGLKGYVGAQA